MWFYLHFGMQEVRKGFTWGQVTIAPLAEEEEEDGGATGGPSMALPVKPDDRLVIPFQNENLYAYILSANGEEKVRSHPGRPPKPPSLRSRGRALTTALTDPHDGARPHYRARLAERRSARHPRVPLRPARHCHGVCGPPVVDYEGGSRMRWS